ncbi:MAG: Crp/Fnr family transcriptional regulator [Saprospiraceae bacterium]
MILHMENRCILNTFVLPYLLIMHIDVDILFTWGAVAKKFKKGDIIFYEGDACRYYHQIMDGKIKMCCYNDEGRIYTQGFFGKGESFGEPPLFLRVSYPACAVAECDSVILQLSKDTLLKILEEYPLLQMSFIQGFALRIYEKTLTNKNMASSNPEERILGFLNKYKKTNTLSHSKVMIPYTRQQMADFVGLRVETVIRTIKKMEVKKKLELKHHKVYY